VSEPVRVLSGLQPWWWIVLHLDKLVENRRTPVLGIDFVGEVLLHASKSKGKKADKANWLVAHDFVEERFGREFAARIPPIGHLMTGGIVGRASVTGIVRPMAAHAKALAEYPDGVDRRWHMEDQFGYLLKDPRPTPFVAWTGQQAAIVAPDNLLTLLAKDPLS
jgi:hypothetical protein